MASRVEKTTRKGRTPGGQKNDENLKIFEVLKNLIQTLRAFRRPSTGGLEVWGEWGIGRLGEEQGLVKLDGEERSKSQANTGAKLSRTCWCFIRILMHLDQNYWKICLGRRLGGPKSQKMLPRPGAASKIEDRGVSRLPQGSWKLSPDWPKRGQGEAN